MTPKTNKSYFLYEVGHSPQIATLGTVVLKDYANPNIAPSHVCTPLSDEEFSTWASSEPVSGTIVSRKNLNPRVALNLADLVVFDLSWRAKKTEILVVGGGQRQEVFDPSKFLATKVLSDTDAQRKLTLWLSVARSAFILKNAAFRKPKIWMLTGRYLLHDVRTYTAEELERSISAGLSPQVSGIAGGPPVGGLLGLGWDHGMEADMTMPNANVWAAQWRLLDTEYIIKSTTQAAAQKDTLQFGLFPDVTSQGVLRGGTAENAEAWSMRIGPSLHEIESAEGPREEESLERSSEKTYDEWFREGLKWFETEIDDESEESEDEHKGSNRLSTGEL